MARVKYYNKDTQAWEYADGNSIAIDTEMSDNSTNTVQNKVVKKYIDDNNAITVISGNVAFVDGTKPIFEDGLYLFTGDVTVNGTLYTMFKDALVTIYNDIKDNQIEIYAQQARSSYLSATLARKIYYDIADNKWYPTTSGHRYSTYALTEQTALSKTNTTAYTPTADYHPATKKYVDDNIDGAVVIPYKETYTAEESKKYIAEIRSCFDVNGKPTKPLYVFKETPVPIFMPLLASVVSQEQIRIQCGCFFIGVVTTVVLQTKDNIVLQAQHSETYLEELLTYDETPTTGSTNLVNSGNIKKYVDESIPAPITIDSAISATSTNPVQNKVVKTYVDNGLSGKASTSHNQSASTITAGVLDGQVNANPNTTAFLDSSQIRNIEASTIDLTPNSSPLTSGAIYLVYTDSKEIDYDLFRNTLKDLTDTITFTNTAYDGTGGVDLSKNKDRSVIAVINGQNATIYADSGVKCPNTLNDIGLFRMFRAKPIFLTGLDTSHTTDMKAMFNNFLKETTLDLSSFNTAKVTTMDHMFYNCYASTIVGLEHFNTSKVTSMADMFSACRTTSLNLSSFDTSSVTDMSNMFSCEATEILGLKNFNTSKVTNMYGMFNGCKATTLDLSSFDMSQVSHTDYMFANSAATTVYCRTQADLDKMKNSLNCSATGFQLKLPKEIDFNLFRSTLQPLTGSVSITKTAYTEADGVDISKNKDRSVIAVVNGQNATVYADGGVACPNTANDTGLFQSFKANILNLTGLDTSNVTNMTNMLSYCKATTLDLTSFNTSNVTNMFAMFFGCEATTLDLSSFDMTTVTHTDNMFTYLKVTTVYCRTQEDLDKMKNSVNCMATGFQLKQ